MNRDRGEERTARVSTLRSTESRWAVILGPSAGTGLAIARAITRDHGFHLFGVHRGNHHDEVQALAAEVEAAGRRAVFRTDDAGSAAAAAAGADELVRAAGRRSVSFFVHSLADASVGRFFPEAGEALVPRQVEKTFDSMAHSFVYWVQALVARDLLAPGARLLALTNPLHESLIARCGLISASKAALEAYVRCLALELGPRGYRVNLLKFATVVTPAVAVVYGERELERVEAVHRQMIPAGRMCTTDEVGRFVSLLLDARAEWLNGATLDFTGAMTQSLLDLVLVPR
jgi:NAD(P)-dependent dehydrogenase (short-subunit alcohol dehydrogenase family)